MVQVALSFGSACFSIFGRFAISTRIHTGQKKKELRQVRLIQGCSEDLGDFYYRILYDSRRSSL